MRRLSRTQSAAVGKPPGVKRLPIGLTPVEDFDAIFDFALRPFTALEKKKSGLTKGDPEEQAQIRQVVEMLVERIELKADGAKVRRGRPSKADTAPALPPAPRIVWRVPVPTKGHKGRKLVQPVASPRNAASTPPIEWESEAALRPRWRRAC